MDKMLTLPAWANLYSIPFARAKKYADDGLLLGAIIQESGRGASFYVPETTLPPVSDDVVCQVCKKSFQQIAQRHTNLHGMTLAEYREAYPDAPLVSKSISNKISQSKIGHVVTDEMKSAISKANTGNKYSVGRVLSDTTKDKISMSKMGKSLTEEHKHHISEGRAGRVHGSETLQKFRDVHAARSEEDKQEIQRKMRETSLQRYGVEVPSQQPSVIKKTKETHENRYGGWAATNPEIRKKTEETNEQRYGGHPSSRPEARAAIRERVGDMSQVRSYFEIQTGFKNPFEMKQYQDQARQTMLERYGVEHALQNEEIKSKMQQNIMKIYGVNNVASLSEIKQKMQDTCLNRYGRRNIMQVLISDETLGIIGDSEKFGNFIDKKSLNTVAKELNISYETVRRSCYRHGIELPKSSYEREMAAFLRSIGVDDLKMSDRTLIYPYEIDLYSASKKMGVEFCGLYWHQESERIDRLYHLTKQINVEAKDTRLITIFEDEWVNKQSIVESRLKQIFGMGDKGIMARKLSVRPISSKEIANFLDTFHIQGKAYGFASYGAFDGEHLVAVMNFSKPRLSLGRKNKDGENAPIELLRFCTDGRSHPGVASKLFTAFIRDHNPDSVISYADRRWSYGNLYTAMGFAFAGASRPGYSYANGKEIRRHNRFGFRKDKIKNLVPDGELMSETEIMKQLGYWKIWDCGNLKFVWSKPPTP
jgi:hypothetical protein